MVDKPGAPTPKSAADQTADKIETAVKSDDLNAYRTAVQDGYKDYAAKHTGQDTQAYVAAVTKKLQDDHILPAVSLMEAKQAFTKMDIDGNERLTRGELDLYKHRDDVNDLQKQFVGQIERDYDRDRNYNQYFENWHGGNSDAISKKDVDAGLATQQNMLHLFAKDTAGHCLADKILNKDGNIDGSTLDQILKYDKSLTPEDRASLETLKANESLNQKWNPFADDQKKADLEKLAEQNGTTLDTLQSQKPGSLPPETRTAAPAGAATPEQEKAAKERKERDDKVHEALKVGKGEGYWQSAERLLALAGHNNPTPHEVRELAHQLRAANRNARELHKGDTLNTDDKIKKEFAALFATS